MANLMRKISYIIGVNTLAQVFGKSLAIICSLITISALTRYLGEKDFGNFVLIFTYFTIFGSLADFGLQLTMVRELSKDKNLFKKTYGTFLWLKIFLICSSTLLAIFLLFFFPYSKFLKIGVVIASLGVAVGSLNSYATAIFQAKLRLDLSTLVDLIARIAITFFTLIFIFLKLNFYSLLTTVLIGNLTGTILAIFLLRKLVVVNLDFDFGLAKKVISISFPIFMVSFLSLLYFKIDTIILSFYRSPRELGIYGLAYKVIENILITWGFYIASIFPLLSNLFSKKSEKAWIIWNKSLFLGMIMSVVIMIVVFVSSPLIIKILGGGQFKESILALRILLLALPFFVINNLFYYLFLLRYNIKNILYIIGLSLILNLVLNLFFVPKWGYIACAVNTVIAEALLTIIYFFVHKSLKNFRNPT